MSENEEKISKEEPEVEMSVYVEVPVDENEQDLFEDEDIFEDSKNRIEEIYQEAKDKISQIADTQMIQDILNKAKEESLQVLSNVKEKVSSSETINDFKNNEKVQSFIEKSTKKVDDIRSSQALKETIDKAEDLSDKLHEVVFKNLRKIIKE
ncbi:hypothetical protein [Floccifex sp.]|uniref:hypothetical protein n=1 Tax=Floccifex sp. TaxID=2815810 RepID=UPI003F0408D4